MAKESSPIPCPKSAFMKIPRLRLQSLESRDVPAVITVDPSAGDAGLRNAVATVDTNGDADNTINLGNGTYTLTSGEIVIQNLAASTVARKSLTLVGVGESPTVTGAAGNASTITDPTGATSRLFEVVGTTADLSVTFRSLSLIGNGAVHDGGSLGGAAALGGGVLITGGSVTLDHASVSGSVVGNDGTTGAAGGAGTDGQAAYGGGVYLADGQLTLQSAVISGVAQGGAGGTGGIGNDGGNG